MRGAFRLILLLNTTSVFCAELSGELESTLLAFGVADTIYWQQAARARTYLRQDLGGGARVELGLDATTYSGKTSLRLLDLLPESYETAIDSLATLLFGADPRARADPPFLWAAADAAGQLPSFNSIRLDRALIVWPGPGFTAEVGRQPLTWGAGYAWNPTNVFDRKNLLEPTRMPRGLDAIRVRVGRRVRFEGVLRVDDRPEESGAALRASTSAGGWDLSAIAARQRWRRMDWERWMEPEKDDPPSVVEWEAERPYLVLFNEEVERITLGGDLRGEIRGVGCWVEAAWNRLDLGRDFWDLTAGVDHLFDWQTYLLAEYHLEGEGRRDPNDYSLNDWMKTLTGERAGMGRHYGFVALNHPIGELSELSLLAFANLSDRSTWLEAQLEHSLADDLVLAAAADLPFGGEEDELGRFGPGGFLRFEAFF
ncbi:MAG: hypothetical protein CME06_18355 [Gemmatimonadetes bacterium]|nr:hypothetical protein [Gemmatimonadota bacterium]